jgi:predicted nucleic acid-binding protein
MDCVVDAGALLELLLRGPRAPALERALDGRRMAAPTHVDVEVLAALHALERGGLIDQRRVEAVLADLHAAPVERYSVRTLVRPMWALRSARSAYDACYVALAARLSCPLLTTDERIAAVPDLPATVIAVTA